MKKQLSILAGSVLLASGAHAATVGVGGNAVAVFDTAGVGTYIIDTGVTADALAAGNGFQIDVSAALAALGSIDSYAVLGLTTPTATGLYNYDSGSYVDVGAGVVYASSTGGGPAVSQNNTVLQTGGVATYLNNANFGLNVDGSGGDASGSAAILTGFGGLLNAAGALSGLFVQDSDFTGLTSSPDAVTILTPTGAIEGVYLDGTTFSATAVGSTVVPVPAAAWLFGSALVGLGVVRRR